MRQLLQNKFFETGMLIFIIFVAAILRLYQIGTVPPSPDWDEVALGYNAYSILLTGRDEYGEIMPFVLQSFDDYKPALYTYLIIPFLPFFDLSVFSIRLPSAIFGILTVLATYFLVKVLFQNRGLALLTAFLLAISPWHIQFSRVAFETNVGLAFNVFGALFFLKGLKKPWYLLGAALFFGLNVSVYQSDRIFTPLLLLTLICIFWRQLFSLPKKFLFLFVVIGMITVVPLVYALATNSNALARLKGVSIFSEPTHTQQEGRVRYSDDQAVDKPLASIFHNQFVGYSRDVLSGYLSHYDFKWIFLEGDLPRHHVPFMGLLYLWELPFLLVGFYILLFGTFSVRTKLLVFLWFFLAPVPAAITHDVPHAVRTLNFLPTFQVFIALGVLQAILFIKHNQKSRITNYGIRLIAIIYFLFVTGNFFYYLNQYFVQQNHFYSREWQYGYKEAVASVKSLQNKYSKVVVSNQVPLDQSYMYFLFYLKYSPQEYQQTSKKTDAIRSFDKYEFRPIIWVNEEKDNNALFVGRPEDFGEGAEILRTIHYLDGKPAIVIGER